MNSKRPPPRHTIIKMPKVTDRERIIGQQKQDSQLAARELP